MYCVILFENQPGCIAGNQVLRGVEHRLGQNVVGDEDGRRNKEPGFVDNAAFLFVHKIVDKKLQILDGFVVDARYS